MDNLNEPPVENPVENSLRSKSGNEKKMKKMYSIYALAITIFGVVVTLLQFLGSLFGENVLHIDVSESSWFPFLNIIIPMYVICFPILFLVLRKQEVVKPERHKLSVGKYLLFIPLMAAMIGVGAVIGITLNLLITLPFGVNPMQSTEISSVMMNSNPFWRIITAGILAPIVEETIFRKFLIDRTYRYGEWVAILTSGIMFGLFHGNFAQCFFAAFIGGLFAYIYIRTGQVWYTIGLHMILNLSTSVITMAVAKPYLSVGADKISEYSEVSQQYLLSGGNPELEERLMTLAAEIVPKMVPYFLWTSFMGTVMLAGIVLWIIFLVKKKAVIKTSPDQVNGGMKFAWGNIGMVLFLIYSVVSFVFGYISIIANYGGKFSLQ